MGGGGSALVGGRTTVAGSFVAERTHKDPLVYTLVSIGSPSGRVGGQGHEPSGSGAAQGAGRKGRGVFSERAPIQCTVLSALKHDESYLSADDAPAHRGAPTVAAASVGGSSPSGSPGPGPAPGKRTSPSLPPPSTPSHPGRRGEGRGLRAAHASNARGRGGASGAGAPLAGAPDRRAGGGAGAGGGELQAAPAERTGTPEPEGSATAVAPDGSAARPGAPGDVFGRLAQSVRQPWVASRTDSQLLSYLAERGRDPQVAAAATPRSVSSPLASSWASSSLGSSRRRRRYKNHHELFDACLSRGSRTLPAPSSPTASVWKGGRRLADFVEEIKVLPDDPVGSFMEASRFDVRRKRSSEATADEGPGPPVAR